MKKILAIFACMLSLTACGNLGASGIIQSPLKNERGEAVPTNNYRSAETEKYKVIWCGVDLKGSQSTKFGFTFGFVIKDPKTKIQYVKVQSVIPGDVLTFIDETGRKNKKEWESWIAAEKDHKVWKGRVYNVSGLVTPNEVSKYLFKFTIKAVGEDEVVLYQPVLLPVLYGNPLRR